MTDRIREAAERTVERIADSIAKTAHPDLISIVETAMREAVADAYTLAMNECARIAAIKENDQIAARSKGDLVAATAFSGSVIGAGQCEAAIFSLRHEAIRRGEGE